MTVHLDTSVLVDALTGLRRSFAALERTVARGHVIAVSALALYEWLRGPRAPEEVEDQEALLPGADARGFGPAEARRAAELYRTLKRARGRDRDIAIGACAPGARRAALDAQPRRHAGAAALRASAGLKAGGLALSGAPQPPGPARRPAGAR